MSPTSLCCRYLLDAGALCGALPEGCAAEGRGRRAQQAARSQRGSAVLRVLLWVGRAGGTHHRDLLCRCPRCPGAPSSGSFTAEAHHKIYCMLRVTLPASDLFLLTLVGMDTKPSPAAPSHFQAQGAVFSIRQGASPRKDLVTGDSSNSPPFALRCCQYQSTRSVCAAYILRPPCRRRRRRSKRATSVSARPLWS